MSRANTAAAEPSMEEILASIRRIIADEDPGTKAAAEPAAALPPLDLPKPPVVELAPPPPAREPPPARAPVEEDVLDLAMAQAEAEAVAEMDEPLTLTPSPPAAHKPAPAPAPILPPEPAPPRPEPIAELIAAVEAPSAPAVEPAFDVAFEEPRPALRMPEPEPLPVPEPVAPPAPEPESAPTPSFASEPELPPMSSIASTFRDTPSPRPEPVAFMARPEPAYAEPAPRGETLISSEASEAVSSAFGSLAHTIFSREARTIEDLTKDMLRPLLKQWLDDNLPGLVERLVREEIERVARGRR